MGSYSQGQCNLLDDADAYVNSVMSSQGPSVLLITPLPSERKRYLSASDVTESDIKKARNDKCSGDRLKVKA